MVPDLRLCLLRDSSSGTSIAACHPLLSLGTQIMRVAQPHWDCPVRTMAHGDAGSGALPRPRDAAAVDSVTPPT